MDTDSCDPLPKEFEKSTPIFPLSTPGILTLGRFKQAQLEIHQLEYLKRTGLTDDEIKLYHDNEAGLISQRKKIESAVLQDKLIDIYSKLAIYRRKNTRISEIDDDEQPGTSGINDNHLEKSRLKNHYPDQHPMNSIQDLEQELFDHLKGGKISSLSKRRKILRRLSRKEANIDQKHCVQNVEVAGANPNPNSLWDVQEMPRRKRNIERMEPNDANANSQFIGPRRETRYTVRDNRIVRLEPIQRSNGDADQDDEYQAVDIRLPVNQAEERLLEGTKLSVDEIRKMDRFKDWQPGEPSKVLFLKNISPAASDEDISILFNQFLHENRGPINVRLMTGRLRGQAFVHFQYENVAIQALEDVNGTIVKGRPIIVQFGNNSANLENER